MLFVASPTPTPTPTPVTGAGAGVGIRLLDIPAASQDDPRARANIVDNLPPGTTIHRRITVSNFDDAPRDVQVYAAASTIADGKFSPDDNHPNELTSWITVDQPVVHLAAKQAIDVTVTIAVPADAPEAEQYATVWAQIGSPKTAGVNTASRAGVRVYLSVGPGNGPPADFAIQSLTASRTSDNIPQLTALIANTGGRAVDVSGTVSLTGGPGSTSAGPFKTSVATTILPGQSATVTIPLDAGLAAGPWNAAVDLNSGLIVHDTTATLTFPQAGTTAAVQTTGFPGWAITLIAILIILIIAAAIILILRRRKQRDSDHSL
jgi:hypothetical protein